jgi:hypothetical protein
MGRTYITAMTRKDEMREGFVARTFHIPIDIDDRFRMEAVKKRIRFSDMAILAFGKYLQAGRYVGIDIQIHSGDSELGLAFI